MPGIALGLFALGCSPGGSGSNAFSYLLGGDVSLSITMTLVSTVAALGNLVFPPHPRSTFYRVRSSVFIF